MVFYNATSFIGQVIATGSASVTGDIFLSLFIVYLVLLAICVMFGIDLTFANILLMPFILGGMIVFPSFTILGGIILIMLAFAITRSLPFH